MMSSSLGANVPHITPPTYTDLAMLDEFSRQQSSFPDSSRRISRHPNGQRTSGVMRIVKPSSANNSPQTMMARRRTMMNDGHQSRRRQQALDQALLQQMQDTTSYYANRPEHVKRSSRPVSWHPSSHLADAQPMDMQIPHADFGQFAMPVPNPYHPKECFVGYQNLPPTPAAYSGHTSPVSSFSPSLLPYGQTTQVAAMPAYISESWMPTTQLTSNCFNPSYSPDVVGSFPAYNNQASYGWHTYAPEGLQSYTTPPTPDECRGLRQPEAVPPEESIPFQALEEPDNEEEEGEILVGMGLYDQPTKADTDPELDHYRLTTSQLLDTTYRTGKGWKLEEAWEPPTTDDEDADEDVDGEDQESDPKTTESPPAQQAWI
ncbi:hypothetical protein NUW58_g8003 [Xylaria curta]|uniref:Uncharacterized protein n=1 Tax=Xylaria curta TaxID=42375 RepID=A0ACC1NDS5_9PEZI|nr:hypothetical protein NUW58_g8003 [Xylaria curta]